MILTLTSDTYSQGELYDFASTQLAPTISQIDGVGDVDVGGSSLPAVRVGLNPQALFNQGVSLDDVRTAISNANVRKPQGALEDGTHRWQIQTNDELKTAAEYQPLIYSLQTTAARFVWAMCDGDRLSAGCAQRRDDQRQTGYFADDPQAAGSQYYPDGRQHPGKITGVAGNHSGGD
ncbi:multidrug resistance protein [Escherichia coli]|uniref:Multidrug resistance protein n=1 Tax=Escherichia coli TaxID=562 RepID=A0A377CEG2_ECOLX|nr:multidrug resistance protein [Escherichia coli]